MAPFTPISVSETLSHFFAIGAFSACHHGLIPRPLALKMMLPAKTTMRSDAGPLLDYTDWAIEEEVELCFRSSWSLYDKRWIGGYQW